MYQKYYTVLSPLIYIKMTLFKRFTKIRKRVYKGNLQERIMRFVCNPKI